MTPGIDAAQTGLALKRFARDLRADNQFHRSRFTVMFLNTTRLEQATLLLDTYRSGKPKALHTLDALHLASAITAQALLPEAERTNFFFVNADKQLCGCAADQGLAVINPNQPRG
jgi:hypothetical protein